MAGAGNVVPHYLGGELSQEKPAGVLHSFHPSPGVVHHQAQVLRSDSVDQVNSLFHRVHQHHPSLAVQGASCHVPPGQVCQQQVKLFAYFLHQVLGVGYEDGGRQRVVFRLGDQVGGTEGWIGVFVGHHDGLGGAEDPVDVYLSLHQFFGQGHKQVSRAADFVHFGHRLGAISHGADGGHSTYLENGINPGDLRRYQHRRVQRFPSPARRGQYDLPHPGDPGRDCGHQHG